MNSAAASPVQRLRTLAVLGRVSNLPTIPSNCLAGWLLGGGSSVGSLGWLCLGAVLIYTGGMFLNDAVDAGWDRQHRPERPIPAGHISRGSVLVGAIGLLAVGWLFLWMAGTRVAWVGAVLVATVVVYDLVHKRVIVAPLLMAGCRASLYLTAAAAGTAGVGRPAFMGAVAIAGYVAGLSFVARAESAPVRAARWPVILLILPLVCAVLARAPGIWPPQVWAAGVLLLFWIVWCSTSLVQHPSNPGRAVSGLLAGIPLVDGLAATGESWWLLLAFGALAGLARAGQRLAPAT